jgi:hypothetical protein
MSVLLTCLSISKSSILEDVKKFFIFGTDLFLLSRLYDYSMQAFFKELDLYDIFLWIFKEEKVT